MSIAFNRLHAVSHLRRQRRQAIIFRVNITSFTSDGITAERGFAFPLCRKRFGGYHGFVEGKDLMNVSHPYRMTALNGSRDLAMI